MITSPPPFAHSASPEARRQEVDALITQLNAAPSRPILLGPWRSELGFEVLYWIPFLRWLADRVTGCAERAVIVTRGGLAPLYAHIAAKAHDLYVFRTPAEVRRENLWDYHTTKMLKQTTATDWDRAVIDEACTALGHSPVVHWIHPAWMYWALAPWWDEETGLKYLLSLTRYDTQLPKPEKPQGLPEQYACVRFYGRATFPIEHQDVQQAIQRVVTMVAAQHKVIVLGCGSQYDDHLDLPIRGPNVIILDQATKPEQNLWLQMAILAHASLFVGTYGGVAQLALRLGVPSVSFWHTFAGTARAHLDVSHWIANETKTPFVAGAISNLELWQQCLMAPVRVASETAPALLPAAETPA